MNRKRIAIAGVTGLATLSLVGVWITTAGASSRQADPLPPPTTTWNSELPPPPGPGAQVPVMGRDGQPVLNPDGSQRMYQLPTGPPPLGPERSDSGPPVLKEGEDPPPEIVGTIEPPTYYIEDLPPQ